MLAPNACSSAMTMAALRAALLLERKTQNPAASLKIWSGWLVVMVLVGSAEAHVHVPLTDSKQAERCGKQLSNGERWGPRDRPLGRAC